MFGKSNRRQVTGPTYDPRNFFPSDARLNALDDYHVILTAQSGLNGITPLHNVNPCETPSGFDYMTNIIGLGGTPAPFTGPTPLVYQPQFVNSFLQNLG